MSSREVEIGRWPIPVHYQYGSRGEDTIMFSSPSKELEIDIRKARFIKLNYGQKGFYRVRYDGELLGKIGDAIDKGEIGDVDVWGIENDLFAFARSGKIKLKEYLHFVYEHCLDCGYPVNNNLLSHLNFFYTVIPDSALRKESRKVLADLCGILFGRLGFEEKKGDSPSDIVLRGSVIFTMGMMGDKDIVKKSRSAFNGYLKRKASINSNLKGAIYGTVAMNGGKSEFNILKKLYLAERIPEDKVRFLRALGGFRSEELMRSALAFTLSEKVRYQDAFSIPAFVLSNPAAKGLMLHWLMDNWTLFQKRYPSGTHLLRAFASFFSTQADEKARSEIVSFFKRKGMLTTDVSPELRRSLEKISTNIELMRVNGLA
jgi:aminopeptidase N